ncbi:MAG: ZIP family metal transporter [Chloroflexi bacterium]|nr:ZIP family metal transporter [Chloroflexota bacterium]
MTVVLNAFLLSLVAGLATGLGGLLVLTFRRFDMRVYDSLLGFAAGVMTAVATMGLIHEALTEGGTLVALAGVAIGAAAMFLLDRQLPHEHEHLPFVCTNHVEYRRGLLLMTAMALHNIPEGLAVGTSYAAQPRLGLLLALAIALHNIPEGIAVAGPFRACGMPARRYLGWTLASGMSEPLAALVGAVFVSLVAELLPLSLAFAGGAMLYVVSDELIPESHSHGYEHQATFGFLAGFLVLVALMRAL